MIDLLVVVDDREGGRQTARTVADATKMRFLEFAEPKAALEALLEVEEPFVLVLDHNFEDDDWPGHRVANELRERHTFGLLLPIIYLSGYMTGHQFLDLLRTKLAYAPTAFLSKKDSEELLPTVRRIAKAFEQLEANARTQAMSQAYASLAEIAQ